MNYSPDHFLTRGNAALRICFFCIKIQNTFCLKQREFASFGFIFQYQGPAWVTIDLREVSLETVCFELSLVRLKRVERGKKVQVVHSRDKSANERSLDKEGVHVLDRHSYEGGTIMEENYL